MLNGFDVMGHRKEHPDFQDVNKYGEESHSSAEGKVGLMELEAHLSYLTDGKIKILFEVEKLVGFPPPL